MPTSDFTYAWPVAGGDRQIIPLHWLTDPVIGPQFTQTAPEGEAPLPARFDVITRDELIGAFAGNPEVAEAVAAAVGGFDLIYTARDEAQAAQAAAEAARDGTIDLSNIDTSDDLVEALVKNAGGVGPKTSAALLTSFVPKNAEGKVAVTGKPNGTLTAFDTGQPVINFGNHPLSVSGGALVHTVGQAQNAGYVQVEASDLVTYVRAEVQFPNVIEANASAVAIVIPTAAWANGVLTDAGIHLVMFGNGIWHNACWEAGVGESTWYATSDADVNHPEATVFGRFADCRDGTWREIAVWIEHDTGTCTVQLPDGSIATMSHPLIGQDCGEHAIWELYETAGTETPAKLRDLAFDTFTPDTDSAFLPRKDLSPLLGGLKSERRRYVASGNGSLPPGTIGVFVTLIAGGGGGGSGRRGAAGSVRCGGGAGGSGGVINGHWFPASALGAGYNVVVGAGGSGGAAVTADDTNGNAGTDGTLSSFVSGTDAFLRVLGGAKGSGGTNATGTNGGAGAPLGTAGSAASTTGGTGTNGSTVYTGAPGGAGAGGGITAADVASAGGAGGSAGIFSSLATGGAAGAVGGAAPGAGRAALDGRPGDGPGGGAASITGAAQAGGSAAGYGAGGGGGGAALNGNPSGAGGAGKAGYVDVVMVRL